MFKKINKYLQNLKKCLTQRKATYLKDCAKILVDKYDSDIPNNVEDLCKLPGVGPKMAYLAMSSGWNQVVGIG